MAIEHKLIADAERHPPKGAAAATLGQVPVSDGSADVSWALPQIQGQSAAALGDIAVSDGSGGTTWEAKPSLEYGAVYFRGNTTATTIGTLNTYVSLATSWAAVPGNTMTVSTSNLVVGVKGRYQVHANISIANSNVALEVLQFEVAVGGTVINKATATVSPDNSQVASMSINTIHDFNASDNVHLMIKNVAAANNATVSEASLSLVLIEET